MIAPRWRKVIRDLVSNKTRTFLVILTIAVGVFAFGSVFITRDGLLKNLTDQYRSGHDASITLFLPDFDQDLVDWIKTQPNVENAQGRAVRKVKLITAERDFDLDLYAFADYTKIPLAIPFLEQGTWPPQKQELVLERGTASYTKLKIYDTALIELPSGQQQRLKITGLVYSPTSPPPSFSGMLTGYVSFPSLRWLGYSNYFNRLEVRPTQDIISLAQAENLASQLKDKLKQRGIVAQGSFVLKPNVSPGQDPSNAFMAILGAIGIFSLILSAFLVVNTISAVITQQKQQIGIMKAIGANYKQVTSLYLSLVGFYGFLSLFIALPISLVLGYLFLKMVTGFINLNITYFRLPLPVLLLQIAAALFIPVVAALYPIILGTKVPIREALSGMSSVSRDKFTQKILGKFGFLSRPVLLSLRNTFRKRTRLFLTLSTLTLGGTLFISVINVRQGMFIELQRLLQLFDFSVSLSLADDYELQPLLKRALTVEGVKAAEGRTAVSAQVIHADQTKGTSFSLIGVPQQSAFLNPTLLSGRWLVAGDQSAAVLSSAILRDEPQLKVGDRLTFETAEDKYNYNIVGIYSASGEKEAYTDFYSLSLVKKEPGKISILLVKTEPNSASIQDRVAKDLEDMLKRSGIEVVNVEKRHVLESSISASFDFLVFFLMIMAVMVALVGGLGLAGTMSLNVMERTREIGIMRSIGASDRAIRNSFILEGVVIAFLSWLFALPLSLPLTKIFDIAIGKAFFERVLVFTFEMQGIFFWLILVMLIAVFSSILPAIRAGRISIKDTLAYE